MGQASAGGSTAASGGGGGGGSGGGETNQGGAAGSMASLNPLQCLTNVDFWLSWVAHFCGTGCGLTLLNNLGQIGGGTYSELNIVNIMILKYKTQMVI